MVTAPLSSLTKALLMTMDTTSDKEESTWDAVKGFFGQKKEDETAQRWLIHSDLYDKPRNRVHDGNRRVIYDEKTAEF